jgi:hypothetical protein
MAGLNRQVRGELDHSHRLRAGQSARSFSDHFNKEEMQRTVQSHWQVTPASFDHLVGGRQ